MMTSLNSRIGTQQASMSNPHTDVTSGVSITGPHNFRAGTTSVRTGGPNAPVVHIASHTEVFADDNYSTDRDDKNVGLLFAAQPLWKA